MNFRDVPPSDIVGKDFRIPAVTAFLEQIVDGGLFTHSEEIDGYGISGRILLVENKPGAVALKNPLSAEAAARHLNLLRQQARYKPSRCINGMKGWQVRKATLQGKPVAIIFAEWIHLR
jgi:hypothetical protein